MKFYEIDNALQEAVIAADKPVRVRIAIDFTGNGNFESIFEQDIVEADFSGWTAAAGGTSARGEVLLDNPQGIYSYTRAGPGTKVKISFSLGEGLAWVERFILYVDYNGIQDIRGPGRKRFVRLGLQDLSAKLRRTDEARDWTASAVFTYSMICDKTQPEKSLVHGIAKRAGFGVTDIDCSTIPVTLPYVRLRKDIWTELSDLSKTYRCHFADGDLYRAAIYGRPIVLDINRSCFLRDSEGIAAYGTAALNVTGSYFSGYEIDGRPQYEDWVKRELAERIQNRREFTVKTHRGLFNARIGAKVRILTQKELLQGTINAFTFRYRKDEAFQAAFHITEEGHNEEQTV
jgi:hypothetical protein